ncbi:MAG: redoxin family protein [Gammaproteobacteria bacterium]|nr:redoxin family protein [Gammaproteobacteria bacterium]
MKSLLVLALSAISATAIAVMPGDRVDDFQLLDHEGNSHQLYYHSDADAIVIMIHGNGCPIVRQRTPGLERVRDAFADQDVRFFLLNANIQDDRQSIAAEAGRYNIDFPIMIDTSQLIAESLGVDRTSEVFVIESR